MKRAKSLSYILAKIIPALFLLIFSISSCLSPRENKSSGHKVKLSNPVKIPVFHLSYWAENKTILQDYLSSSKDWHVAPIDGPIVALPRAKEDGCKPLRLDQPGGYSDSRSPFPKANFLNLYPLSNVQFHHNLKNVFHENSTAYLSMKKSEDSYLSSLAIIEEKDKNLTIQVFENSLDNSRSFTTSFLTDLSSQMSKIKKVASSDASNINLSILPPKSAIISPLDKISIERSRDEGFGRYIISGYINPGERGFIYLKINKKSDGKGINMVAKGGTEGTNSEYVGWSKNPKQKFNFCLAALLQGGSNDSEKILAEFQIWFRPSNGGLERLLHKKTLVVNVYLK